MCVLYYKFLSVVQCTSVILLCALIKLQDKVSEQIILPFFGLVNDTLFTISIISMLLSIIPIAIRLLFRLYFLIRSKHASRQEVLVGFL